MNLFEYIGSIFTSAIIKLFSLLLLKLEGIFAITLFVSLLGLTWFIPLLG